LEGNIEVDIKQIGQ